MTFRRYVAVGDSLTEGKGDFYPNGEERGWADMLAVTLSQSHDEDVVYANLSKPSVRSAEILAEQVPQAVRFEPDLITVNAGVNDAIALRYVEDEVEHNIAEIFEGLRRGAPDARIVTPLLPDLSHASLIARVWRSRVHHLNAVTKALASDHGIDLVDLGSGPLITSDELALDRVHPSPRGHRRFATAFAEILGLPTPDPSYLRAKPRAETLYRLYRLGVVAPQFISKRLNRELIAAQPAKRPELLPV